MVRLRKLEVLVLFFIADMAFAKIGNESIVSNQIAVGNKKGKPLINFNTRRKKGRSTSSSSGEKEKTDKSASGLSLDMSDSSSENSQDDKKRKKQKRDPKSSLETKGWRKWHRKCTPCREDMEKKWRDPSISWICGAYQRARRSFKSLCMMHLRNCQDGTMFVKIRDHRCDNRTETRGNTSSLVNDHFFYDYKVTFTDDSSKTEQTSSDTESEDKSLSYRE